MKITVEFESMEEFQKHMVQAAKLEINCDGIMVRPTAQQQEETPAEPTDVPFVPTAVTEPEPAEKPEPAPAITEDFRVEVRKVLATLNKMQTGNPAKALIAETGYKRLTDVPLDLLPGLMDKAKGAMNNA